jgi:hypothetical protein
MPQRVGQDRRVFLQATPRGADEPRGVVGTREEQTSEGRTPRALPVRNKAGTAPGGMKRQEAEKA